MTLNLVLSAFSVICFLLAMLAVFILFFINKEQIFSNRLLALVLFFLGIQSCIIFLLYTGLMIKIPHIYRVFGPTTLLVFPLSYLYVRSVLNGETFFKKNDWIVLIPSVLYAINLLPVYCMPYEKKLILVTNFIANPKIQSSFSDGYLPPYVFSFIRTVWSAYFLFLQFRLIRQFRKKVNSKIVEINKDLLQWLCLFTSVLFILVAVVTVFGIIAPIIEISVFSIDGVLQLLVFLTTIKLFMQPKVLYGIYLPLEKFENNSISSRDSIKKIGITDSVPMDDNFAIIIQDNLKYRKKIEDHFERNTPFLNTNYSLNDLVDEIKVPRHLLSAFINQEYGVGFRKFINLKRVQYLIDNFNQPLWHNLTLEAMANEAGFLNRSTFILNFKEFTGKTPSVYFKNRK